MINEKDLEHYLSSRHGLSTGTIVTRMSRIRIFYHWLDGQITSQIIEEFFWHLKERGLSGTSRNTYLHALRSLEKYLIDRGLSEPFMKGFDTFTEEDPDITPLTNEEIQLIKRNCLKANNYLNQTRLDMIIFLIDTGSRWEDAQALKVKNVDIEGNEVSYNQLKTGIKRIIHIQDPLLSILKKRLYSELVFSNNVGGVMHYSDFHKFLKTFCKKLGITKRVSPHILRHSYAQNSYDQTGDIYLTQNLLGQKSISSTLRYVRNSRKRLKTAQQVHPHVTINAQFDERFKQVREGVRRLLETFAKSPEEEKKMMSLL